MSPHPHARTLLDHTARPAARRDGCRWTCALAGTLLLLTGCAPSPAAQGPAFAATTPPVAAILRELAGEGVQVVCLMQPGASPHTYEPRPSDARAADQALALFYAAKDIDGWAAQIPATRTFETAVWIPQQAQLAWAGEEPAGKHNHEHEEEHGHQHGQYNTHYWGDPLLVQAMLPAFVDAMSEVDPSRAGTYRQNAEKFSATLEALHTAVSARLTHAQGKKVALFHPSWNYFMRRYGIEVAGIVEPYGGKEMSPRFLKELIDHLRTENIIAIFTERQLNPRPAEVVAESGGWRLAELDPLGGDGDRYTYEDLISWNTGVIAEALR